MKFKIGDVVCLSFGSTKMTVNKIYKASCECIWFDKDDNLHKEEISTEALFQYNNLGE
jgi:uncharacterized protein YodC (DUF2158 family)